MKFTRGPKLEIWRPILHTQTYFWPLDPPPPLHRPCRKMRPGPTTNSIRDWERVGSKPARGTLAQTGRGPASGKRCDRRRHEAAQWSPHTATTGPVGALEALCSAATALRKTAIVSIADDICHGQFRTASGVLEGDGHLQRAVLPLMRDDLEGAALLTPKYQGNRCSLGPLLCFAADIQGPTGGLRSCSAPPLSWGPSLGPPSGFRAKAPHWGSDGQGYGGVAEIL